MKMFESTEVDTRSKPYPSPHESLDESDANSSLANDSSSEEGASDADDWNDAADAAVEQIFNKSKKIPPPHPRSKPPISNKIARAPIRAIPSHISEDIEKLERKRFMSHRAGVVSGAVPVASPSSKKKGRKSEMNGNALFDSSGRLSKEEFQKLTREVHLYGKQGSFFQPWKFSLFLSFFFCILRGDEHHLGELDSFPLYGSFFSARRVFLLDTRRCSTP